jgi:hypothetical protein
MVFAGLLGLRKKFPVWRVGRAQSWMRGHLWLGFLSFPLTLLHGGFHFGGTLTRVLMWMFIFVWISGILGTALQHFMPRFQTAQLPMETIYEQIDRVRGQLAEEATQLVDETCSALEGEVSRASDRQRAMSASAGTQGGLTVASGLQANQQAGAQLRQFLSNEVQPYLERAGGHAMTLAQVAQAQRMFQQFRVLLPLNCTPIWTIWKTSARKRQLDKQSRSTRFCTDGCWCTSRFHTRCCYWERCSASGVEVLSSGSGFQRCCDGREQQRRWPSALTCSTLRARTRSAAGASGCPWQSRWSRWRGSSPSARKVDRKSIRADNSLKPMLCSQSNAHSAT